MSHNPQIAQAYPAFSQASLERFQHHLDRISTPFEGWKLIIETDPKSMPSDPRYWVRVSMEDDIDSHTGLRGYSWKGRPFVLDDEMTDSEIIRTGLMAIRIAAEHELNEKIKVDSRRPYDPHVDIPKLAEFVADQEQESPAKLNSSQRPPIDHDPLCRAILYPTGNFPCDCSMHELD